MTPQRLNEIREAYRKCPSAWGENGRPRLRPSDAMNFGMVAIEHRRELIEYIDELLAGAPVDTGAA